MSGGSFEYVCYKVQDTEHLLTEYCQENVRKAEEYCRACGRHDVADELLKYRLDVETHRRILLAMGDRISDLLYAVEWAASGDFSDDGIDKAWDRFLGVEK